MWQALMTDDDDLLTDLQVRRSKGSEVKEGHRGQVGQQGQRGQGGQRSLAICYMPYAIYIWTKLYEGDSASGDKSCIKCYSISGVHTITIVNCDRPSKLFESLHCLFVLVCYSIGKVKVHKVLYLAHKSVQLSDSFPCKFCKILENFVKLVPQLCPFRNFFLSRLKNFAVVLFAS